MCGGGGEGEAVLSQENHSGHKKLIAYHYTQFPGVNVGIDE